MIKIKEPTKLKTLWLLERLPTSLWKAYSASTVKLGGLSHPSSALHQRCDMPYYRRMYCGDRF